MNTIQSDAEFLAMMWTRATNCGVNCFLTYDEITTLRRLAEVSGFEYDYQMIVEKYKDPSPHVNRYKYLYRDVHAVKPSVVREMTLLGMQWDGRRVAEQVAHKIEMAV